MQKSSLRTPLGVLVVGLVMIALLLRAEPQQTASSQGYNGPTAATANPYAAPATATASSPSQSVPTVSANQVQPTALLTPTLQTAPPTAAVPTATLRPTVFLTATPITPTPTATPSVAMCTPGQTLYVSGMAPSRSPLLLFFDERAVGGGSAEASGRFSIPLRVGDEKPGEYVIAVRVRGSMQEVLQTQCTVPTLPTPTPEGS